MVKDIALGQGVRRHADGDDAAGLHDVEAALLCGLNELVALAARIEPELVAAAAGNFRQRFQSNSRRQINADPIEFDIRWYIGERLIDGEPFDLAALWIDGIDRVTAGEKRPHGFVPEFAAIGGSAEDGDGRHGISDWDFRFQIWPSSTNQDKLINERRSRWAS